MVLRVVPVVCVLCVLRVFRGLQAEQSAWAWSRVGWAILASWWCILRRLDRICYLCWLHFLGFASAVWDAADAGRAVGCADALHSSGTLNCVDVARQGRWFAHFSKRCLVADRPVRALWRSAGMQGRCVDPVKVKGSTGLVGEWRFWRVMLGSLRVVSHLCVCDLQSLGPLWQLPDSGRFARCEGCTDTPCMSPIPCAPQACCHP